VKLRLLVRRSGDQPSRRNPFLLTALALALLVFGLPAFGQTATGQHESVATRWLG
jgi:hypothetical protein